jgi:hypothetical protein
MAMLLKSSEIELGASGRAHALRLRDTAQAHLRQSWSVQQIDLGLAEAAMVLALFETSAHPEHDDANADTALLWLDKIIQVLRLTDLDARDPDTLDHSTGVPTVAHPQPLPKQCECTTSPAEGSTTWSFQPAWDPSWDEAEVKAEETRRLCWSALILVANHTVVRASKHREPLNLFLVNSSNVCNSFLCRLRPPPPIAAPVLTRRGRISSTCFSPENITDIENMSPSSQEKIPFGPFIAAACFSGTALCASGMRTSRRRSVLASLVLRT